MKIQFCLCGWSDKFEGLNICLMVKEIQLDHLCVDRCSNAVLRASVNERTGLDLPAGGQN